MPKDTHQSTLLAARNAALYYSKRQQARDNMLTPLSEVEAFREGYEEGAAAKESSAIVEMKAEYVCEFTSFSTWVNKANSWIGKFGERQRIICIDKNGDYVHQGSDFMHARDNDLFPVKCFRLIRNTEPLPHPPTANKK